MLITDIQCALFNAYDIRESSDFREIQNLPYNSEGTDITLKEMLDDIIFLLEKVEAEVSMEKEKC